MRRVLIALVGIVLVLAAAGVVWREALAPIASAFMPPAHEPDPSILFVGDIMLDRNVAAHAREVGPGALFAGVLDLFTTADANVANLEGTITTKPSIAQRDNSILHFTFDPELAQEELLPLRLSAASLANNHSYDFYKEGFRSTQEYLTGWGILPFGNPYNATSSISTELAVRGRIFCLVGYHSLYGVSTALAVDEVTRLKPTCYRTIVFAHWGDEYQPIANAAQVDAAHQFIDAGADLVIGAHPHVVQQVEVYRGKAIFYSLGNFMFDQNFSWATTHGLAVKVTFRATSTGFELTPVTVKDEEVQVANEADAARVLGATGRLASWRLP